MATALADVRTIEGGSYHSSPFKTYQPVVIFIHQFRGEALSTRRHQDMVLKMGFDCVSFTLGHISNWASQFENILNQVPGPKIILSLSFPSYLVVQHVAEHGRGDILAWICDGGPFADLWPTFSDYYVYAEPIRNPVMRAIRAVQGYFYVRGWSYERRVHAWMARMDTKLPILSIRSGADLLVPQRHIDQFFSYNPMLNLKTLIIPNVHHLEGLRRNPDLYKMYVGEFLRDHSSKLEP